MNDFEPPLAPARRGIANLLHLFLALLSLALTSCEGGDGGGPKPGNDACGVLGLHPKIVDGTECVEVNSPVVMVRLRAGNGKTYLCSGTMITSTQVLTAAHCYFLNIEATTVEANGRSFNAASVNIHPQVESTVAGVLNDVAVINLAVSPNLPSIPISTSPAVSAGDIIQIFGFGQTEAADGFSPTLGTLRSGEMVIDLVKENQLIAIYNGLGSDTCFGDSGGPAFVNRNGSTALVGVTSSGTSSNCTVGDVSLFANLQDPIIVNFIKAVAPGVRVEGE